MAYLLPYVDDIILTASSTTLLTLLESSLSREFSMTDLGDIHHFLGVNVHRNTAGLFLSQEQYALEVLDRANMLNCHPVTTPIDTSSNLSSTDGNLLSNPTHYRSLAGALQYLTLTRPDISYSVNKVCQFLHSPTEAHWTAVKRILRYLQGTSSYGLLLRHSPSMMLSVFSDADWAGCPDTCRSTSGYCIYLGDSLLSWSSKLQPTVSPSSAEAEYRAVANVVAECCWLRQLLGELHCVVDKASVVFCDNVSAVYLSAKPRSSSRHEEAH